MFVGVCSVGCACKDTRGPFSVRTADESSAMRGAQPEAPVLSTGSYAERMLVVDLPCRRSRKVVAAAPWMSCLQLCAYVLTCVMAIRGSSRGYD